MDVDRTSAVSLHRYWNYIGVPLFFIVLCFGVFVLYSIGPLQSAGQAILPTLIASWKRVPRTLPAAGTVAVATIGKGVAANPLLGAKGAKRAAGPGPTGPK